MGGGAGIAADDVQQRGRADLAADDRLAHAGEVGIEAAVEADLQLDAGLLDRRQRLVDLGQVEGDRLFAEDVLAGLGGLPR